MSRHILMNAHTTLVVGLVLATMGLLTLNSSHAQGQSQVTMTAKDEPVRHLIELNWQAVEAYNKLEIEQANDSLRKALKFAQDKRLGGIHLARTYLTMGIVAIGGSGNAKKGKEYFQKALSIEPAITLDPLLATPDIQAIYDEVKGKVAVKDDIDQRSGRRTTLLTLIHQPVELQVAHTAVPVYVEVPEGLDVRRVFVFYQRSSGQGYSRDSMQRIEDGWGYEIPCREVNEPTVDYYVVAVDKNDTPVASVGSKRNPVRVMITTAALLGEAPALPGRPPPKICRYDCPVGDVICQNMQSGMQREGEDCRIKSDCAAGLVCQEGTCEKETVDQRIEKAPRFFIQLGPTLGASFLTSGMRADSGPPTGSTTTQSDGWIKADADTTDDCAGGPSEYCVRVQQLGFSPGFAIRGAAGYYITPRIALALTLRYQPNAGRQAMAHMLVGGRVQYLLTLPSDKGWWFAVHAGAGGGQIQAQPPQATGSGRPYVASGLGNLNAGGTAGLRLFKNMGFYFTPEIDFMFPNVMASLDFTGGLEVSF